MPIALAVASLVLGVAGTFMQYQAGQQAEANARHNADLQRQETEEAARRQADQNKQTEAMAKARAAASGVKLEGSTGDYLDWMSSENQKQVEWTKRSGYRQAEAIEYGGSLAKSQGTANALATGAQTAGNFYTAGTNADWWQ